VLSWSLIDNRPFLRCLHGAGICAWRLGDHDAAAAIFRKMLWLNPGDHQGARFNLAALEAGKKWEEMEGIAEIQRVRSPREGSDESHPLQSSSHPSPDSLSERKAKMARLPFTRTETASPTRYRAHIASENENLAAKANILLLGALLIERSEGRTTFENSKEPID
jgi:hypothetical protein